MLQSQLFTKTRKEAPKDEVSKNAELLIRGGFIHKELAGVYAYLPLGLRVIRKLESLIREEMNALGGQELSLPALQDKTVWEKSGRWNEDVLDVWFKTTLKNGNELGLATTHEEPLTSLLTEHISSYRDLPLFIYQFQTKFRNELRAKSGIMRGREFLMKDMYSFSRDEAEHEVFYDKVKRAYRNIFDRIGIGDRTYLTKASGGSFSPFSYEFQTITPAGEDIVYITDEKKKEAVNKEIGDPSGGEEKKGVEVGNIFTLGTKFSEALGLYFKDENGDKRPVFMGSYGIGLGRLMGTVVEILSDDKGIVWPESVAPFRVHLLSLGEDEESEKLYQKLVALGVEVLFDDRDLRAGEKFADADLLGIPSQIIIGKETLKSDLYELKDRRTGKVEKLKFDDLLKRFK